MKSGSYSRLEGSTTMAARQIIGHSHQRRVGGVPALLKNPRAWLPHLVLRCPILLYRIGLGALLGHEFLLLTHAGRRSGLVRETVLKVLKYEPRTGESIVASAWGLQTDWYRNLQARGPLAVSTAGTTYVPEMRLVSPDEAFAVFDEWTQRQHRFAELMLGQIGLSWDVPELERRAIVAEFPFVAFRPAARPQPAE